MTQTRICHKCKKPVQESIKPLFRDTCDNCGSYLHCCLNCSLYDEARHNKCKSPTTEVVVDREKFNFCDEFQFKISQTENKSAQKSPKQKWESLFKNEKD